VVADLSRNFCLYFLTPEHRVFIMGFLQSPWFPRFLRLAGLALFVSTFSGSGISQAQTVRLPASQRFLEVRQVRGTVTYRTNTSRPARVGDLLQAVGQGLSTGARSSSVLAVDDGIAFVQVSENTDFQVKTMRIVPGGGKVTELNVTRGQVRLNARPLNNPGSRLEIHTPAGVAGVRGTDFGVTISSLSGRSGVAARSGAVAVSAQNQTVTVRKDEYSTVTPGEPPTPPQPIQRNITLDVLRLETQGANQVRLEAVTDPPNLVFVNSQPIELDKTGRLQTQISGRRGGQISVLVRNPCGEERAYQLLIP
jgi:hypothetical protein